MASGGRPAFGAWSRPWTILRTSSAGQPASRPAGLPAAPRRQPGGQPAKIEPSPGAGPRLSQHQGSFLFQELCVGAQC